MLDVVAAVAAESDRFARAVARAPSVGASSEMMVPSCPDWSLDDLVWHLTEVQLFWSAIVEGGLDDPSAVEMPARPAPGDLAAGFDAASTRLARLLADTDPAERCWSWYEHGHSVGWVGRRQAHEALVHRVDAELTVAAAEGMGPEAIGPVDPELAADGVDEMIGVMLDVGTVPEWATWRPSGPAVRLEAIVDGGSERQWTVRLGRIVGTDPAGVERDVGAIESIDPAGEAVRPDTVIRGPAAELDLWLWRRLPLTRAAVEGDPAPADQLWAMAAME